MSHLLKGAEATAGAARVSNKTICLDFDGVLHSYVSPWTRAWDIPDPPVPGAVEFVRAAIEAGYTIAISSCRADTTKGRLAIRDWLCEHNFPDPNSIVVTYEKPAACIYIDDRGYRFEGTFPSLAEIAALVPWNKKESA